MHLLSWLLLLWTLNFKVHGDRVLGFPDVQTEHRHIENRDPNAKSYGRANAPSEHSLKMVTLSIKRRLHPKIKSTGVMPRGTPVKRANTFSIVTASQPAQTDSMAIDEDGIDYSYFSELRLGSSGKRMYLLIDTGAANTWVMGSDCTSEACSSHDTFGDADSKTLKITQTPFSLSYGTGKVNGVVVSDTMGFADLNVSFSFGSASNTSSDFATYPMDGILGLGRAKSNTMGVPTFMEAVGDAKLLKANLFGINLQRASDGSTDGEINFGAPDDTKYTGALAYTSTVSDEALWEVPVDDAVVNGVSLNFKGKTAIVDTGTSFILMPPTDSSQLHGLIPNSQQTGGGNFNIPCSSTASIGVKISGVMYNISSKDYVGKPVSGGSLCSSNILGLQAFGPNQWLLGDTFLKNVYSVFDSDNSRIGFGINATQIPSSVSVSSSAITSSTFTSSSSTSSSTSSSQTTLVTTSSSLLPSLQPSSPSQISLTSQTSQTVASSQAPLLPDSPASPTTSVSSASTLAEPTSTSTSSKTSPSPAMGSQGKQSAASNIFCSTFGLRTILAFVVLLLYI